MGAPTGRRKSRRELPVGNLVPLARSTTRVTNNLPPPRGVLGCGASTIAIPGVKTWPLTICWVFAHFARRAINTLNRNRTAIISMMRKMRKMRKMRRTRKGKGEKPQERHVDKVGRYGSAISA